MSIVTSLCCICQNLLGYFCKIADIIEKAQTEGGGQFVLTLWKARCHADASLQYSLWHWLSY